MEVVWMIALCSKWSAKLLVNSLLMGDGHESIAQKLSTSGIGANGDKQFQLVHLYSTFAFYFSRNGILFKRTCKIYNVKV